MPHLLPVVNNFIGNNEVPNVDITLKVYILIGSALGADRLELFKNLNGVVKLTIRVLALIINMTIFVLAVMYPPDTIHYGIKLWFSLMHHYLLVILARIHNSTQRSLLVTIRNLDVQYGDLESKKISKSLIIIPISLFVLILPPVISSRKIPLTAISIVIFRLLELTELLLFRELLKVIYNRIRVLSMRLRQINLELNNTAIVVEECQVMRIRNSNLKRIRNAYNQIVDASELLRNSIKWQLTLMVAIDLLPRVLIMYSSTTLMLYKLEESWVICLCIACFEILKSCVHIMLGVVCDKTNDEEEELKVVLAKHLCSCSLDRKGRRLTRAFMAVVDRKGLSFKLLRIVYVGVRLPILCLNLIVTYVIVLLQFGKLAQIKIFSELI